MNQFEKIVEFGAAHDERHPNPSKNYGIGSVKIRFILKKGNKAVSFLFNTDWFLPETVKEYREKGNKNLPAPIVLRGKNDCGVNGWDVGYHSPEPMFEDQSCTEDCEYTGGDCYFDGSSLCAKDNQEILVREGSKGVWKFLERQWKRTFEKKPKKRR